jgi:hypothetical protein
MNGCCTMAKMIFFSKQNSNAKGIKVLVASILHVIKSFTKLAEEML